MDLWRNKKTRNIYAVLSMDVHDATNERDGTICVLYKDENGKLFVRERAEFYEKFEQIKAEHCGMMG